MKPPPDSMKFPGGWVEGGWRVTLPTVREHCFVSTCLLGRPVSSTLLSEGAGVCLVFPHPLMVSVVVFPISFLLLLICVFFS